MKRDKLLSMLGLAAKAGKLKSGEFSVDKAIKEGKAKLVIVAADASDNAKKSYSDSCNYYHVPYMEHGTKEELGHYIGKGFRAAVAVTDDGFAKALSGKEDTDG